MTEYMLLPKHGVLAVDPSLTGLAVVYLTEDGRDSYMEFSSKPDKTLEGRLKRYNKLANNVVDIIKITVPKLCLIEGYAFGAKGASVVTLGEFGGILRDRICGFADATIEVPPTTLKKFITGKGNCKKLDVVSALSAKYGIAFKTDNHADAFGLAQLGRAVLGYMELTNNHQREAVEVVRKSMR
jgi:crossover junction endodeoxyribonuclease RuvC